RVTTAHPRLRIPGSMPKTRIMGARLSRRLTPFKPRTVGLDGRRSAALRYDGSMLAVWLLCGASFAASTALPEIAVVGLHVPGRMGDQSSEDAKRLAKALDDTGKVDGLTPAEMGKRLAGRESLIVDNYALGPGRERLKEGSVLYDRALPDQAIPVL